MVSDVAMTTDDSGSLRNATTITPIPTATAGASGSPGRCDAAMPPAAPRKMAGNVGPPRKLPRQALHASPLHTSRRPNAPSDHVAGLVDEAGQRVLTGEQHLVGAVGRGLREQDRQQRDHEAGGGDEHPGVPRHDVGTDQAEPPDHEREQRAGEPERDGPADLLPGRVREVRELQRLRARTRSCSSPVQFAMPMNTSEPTPAAIRPGMRMSGSVAPPSPLASITSTAATIGRPEDHRDGGEAACCREHHEQLRRCVALRELHREDRQAAADRDQGRLGTEHETEPEGRQRGEGDAGDLGRLGAAHLQPVGRHVPAVAGQLHDRERDREPREHQHRDRPPGGHGVEPERVGQVAEHRELDLVDQLEEPPRGERHEETDHRREHEQHDEVAAAQHRLGIERRCGRRRRQREVSCRPSGAIAFSPGPGARPEKYQELGGTGRSLHAAGTTSAKNSSSRVVSPSSIAHDSAMPQVAASSRPAKVVAGRVRSKPTASVCSVMNAASVVARRCAGARPGGPSPPGSAARRDGPPCATRDRRWHR